MSDWQLSSLHRKRYSNWAGHPSGNPAKPDKCCQNIWPAGRSMIPRQCNRARGYGPEKAYCKQHDPEHIAAKNRIASEKYHRDIEAKRIEWAAPDLFAALCKIADGHNDPRAVATLAIKGLSRENTKG